MFVFDEIAALGLLINEVWRVRLHMYFHIWIYESPGKDVFVSVCVQSSAKETARVHTLHLYQHLHSRPTSHTETCPNWEKLNLYLCFSKMNIDCMFEVQNLIWQAKQHKIRGREELHETTDIKIFLFWHKPLLNYMALLTSKFSLFNQKGGRGGVKISL